MIRFWKSVRQKMLSENKFSKYLLYAVGEIFLVVIGILIAVQINTYYNAQRDRHLETTCLENLKEDLQIELAVIREQLDHEAQIIARVDSCFLAFDSVLSNLELSTMLQNLCTRRTFVANKAAFNNMVNTGDIVLITNSDLQNAMVRYYQQLDYTAAVINNNNLFVIDSQFGAFVESNGFGFRMNSDGEVDESYRLSPEKRFTLNSELIARKKASVSIARLSQLQLEATMELIALLNEELNR
jgi:hypothetical protein